MKSLAATSLGANQFQLSRPAINTEGRPETQTDSLPISLSDN